MDCRPQTMDFLSFYAPRLLLLLIMAISLAGCGQDARNSRTVSAGEVLYRSYCEVCHGARGEGNARTGVPSIDTPRRYRRIHHKIRGVHSGGDMPSFHQLSADDTEAIREYLKTL